MKIHIKVKPNSSKREIRETEEGYTVSLKSSPENNKANKELINLISKHLGVSSSRIRIKMGKTSKRKVLEVV